MNAVELLYALNERGVYLYIKGEQIAVSYSSKAELSETMKESIRVNKSAIIAILQANSVYTECHAKDISVFSVPESVAEIQLSPIQKSILTQLQLDSSASTYTIPFFIRISDGDAEQAKLSLLALLKLESILRLKVSSNLSPDLLSIDEIQIPILPMKDVDIESYLKAQRDFSFSANNGPLINFAVLVSIESAYIIVSMTHSHLVADQSSLSKIAKLFISLYKDELLLDENRNSPTYFDFVHLLNSQASTQASKHALSEISRLCQSSEPLRILLEKKSKDINQAKVRYFKLSRFVTNQLKTISNSHGISLYALLLGLYYLTLTRFSMNDSAFPLCVTVSSRDAATAEAVGPFISTLPFVHQYNISDTLGDNLKNIHQGLVTLLANRHLNLNQIIEEMSGPRNEAIQLFKILFTFHNAQDSYFDQLPEGFSAKVPSEEVEKFGLSLYAAMLEDELCFTLTYSEQSYDDMVIDQVLISFKHLLDFLHSDMLKNSVSAVPLMNDFTRKKLLTHCVADLKPFPSECLLHQLFEQQVIRTPDRPAVIYDETTLTFSQVNYQANQIASFLMKNFSIKPNTPIALMLDRSERLLPIIMGVLKAGGCYVPLSEDFPDDRVSDILQTSRAPILITSQLHKDKRRFDSSALKSVIAYDTDLCRGALRYFESVNPQLSLSSENLAYIIFTSGTTGKPKGVKLPHRGVVNRVHWMNDTYPLDASTVLVQKTPYIFDVSVWELFWGALFGAPTVYPKPGDHKDPHALLKLIYQHSITDIHFVPSMLGVFLDTLESKNDLPLKRVYCSGEALPLSVIRSFHAKMPDIEVHNLYGPTEASVDILYSDCSSHQLARVEIGRPIQNSSAFVLDSEGRLQPYCIPGELHLGGVGLAEGYVNQEHLTNEKFYYHPELEVRLYKTGDLAALMPTGSFLYLGRNDHQVKINGYRIELDDIRSNLELNSDVLQAYVRVVPVGPRDHLVAYFKSSKHAIKHDTLALFLREKLPSYMIPDYFVQLDQFPLTLNGKIDSRNLPAPDVCARGHDEDIELGLIERRIAMEFSKLLRVSEKSLSPFSDFFALGGDSILAIQLVSLLRKEFAISFAVSEIFNHKTIQQLASLVENSTENQVNNEAEQGILQGEFHLSPIQDWFFAQAFSRPHHWNQSFVIEVPSLNTDLLRDCIEKLIQHHDALRLQFPKEEGVIQCFANPGVSFYSFDVVQLGSQEQLEDALFKYHEMINYQEGPGVVVRYITNPEATICQIYFAIHHLIIDAVSWRILFEDLVALYHGKSLAMKTSSYRQYVQALDQYSSYYPNESLYWDEVKSSLEKLKLNYLNKSSSHVSTALKLDSIIATQYAAQKSSNFTLEEIILSSFVAALSQLVAPCSKLCLAIERHGRNSFVDSLDLSRTVGWFTAFVPIVISLEQSCPILHEVRRLLRMTPNNGIGYGFLSGYSDDCLPSICFNYLGHIGGISESGWTLSMDTSRVAASPANRWPFDINILAYVENEQLVLQIDSYLPKDRAESLLSNWVDKLGSLHEQLTSGDGETHYEESSFYRIRSENDLKQLPLKPCPRGASWFPMTDIQKAYLIGRYAGLEIGNVANHVYHEFYYPTLDIAKLENSLNQVVRVMPVLRTVFDSERMLQRYLSTDEISPIKVYVNDFRNELVTSNKVESVRKQLSHRVYDVSKFPLFEFNVSLFKGGVLLHFGMELIILDVKSRMSFIQAVDQVYRTGALPSVTNITFKDYLEYVDLLKVSQWYQRDRLYWVHKVKSMPLRPEFRFLVKPEDVKNPTFSECSLSVEQEDWQRFKSKVSQSGLSYSSVLLALYGKVIAYYTGSKDFLITLTLFNRYSVHPEVDRLLGDFTSTTLFAFSDLNESIESLLKVTHQNLWDDIEHSLFSGIEVQRILAKENDFPAHLAVSPIVFTGVVGSQSGQFDQVSFLEDSEVKENRSWEAQTSQAWIDLQAVETENTLLSKWLYVSEIFDKESIRKMNQLFCALVREVANTDWSDSFDSVIQLSPEDLSIILSANSAVLPLPHETLLNQYQRVASNPKLKNRMAVWDSAKGVSSSHEECWNDSEVIAWHLHQKNSNSPLISVFLEKGYDQVIATLGIMRAGHAYLPLHVDWPESRIRTVLSQSKTKIILSSFDTYRKYPSLQSLSKEFELCFVEDIFTKHDQNLNGILPAVDPDSLAYVIYTSGSTGEPKGVSISHRGVLNTLLAVNSQYHVNEHDRVFALSELSFDLSVYDIFGLLIAGGSVVFPAQKDTKDINAWRKLISSHGVTIWNSVPQLASLLIDDSVDCDFDQMRLYLLSGDWIPLSLPSSIRAATPEAYVVSLGGATEGSIWSIWHEVGHAEEGWSSIPYGKAMPNQSMWVLDSNGNHCPVDVLGEIYIGGSGVAIGYWNSPELTQQRYIQHEKLGRLYRTGDLGRWRTNGEMEFCGRADFQVKINGYRVELTEIEHAIHQIANVKRACAVIHNHNNKSHLVVYYQHMTPLDHDLLLEGLRGLLPTYMVPALLVHIREWPLSSNGKINIKKLPLPPFEMAKSSHSPLNDGEMKLALCWSEILRIPLNELSPTSDFFQLGGDSISAMQLVARIRKKYNIKLPVSQIYQNRTIEMQVKRLGKTSVVDSEPQVKVADTQCVYCPLSSIQGWLLRQRHPDLNRWVQTVKIEMPHSINKENLKNSIDFLVRRYIALQMNLLRDSEGEYRQERSSGSLYHWSEFENTGVSIEVAIEKQEEMIDVFQGPVIAFTLIAGVESGNYLLLSLHHAFADPISCYNLVHHLMDIYHGKLEHLPLDNYLQWVSLTNQSRTQRDEGLISEIKDELEIWSQWMDADSVLHSVRVDFSLDETAEMTRVRESNTSITTHNFLLTALLRSLNRLSQKEFQYVVTETHGRDEKGCAINAEETVGWLTGMRLQKFSGFDTGELLHAPKVTLDFLAAPELHAFPLISFNYFGSLDEQNEGEWKVSSGGYSLSSSAVVWDQFKIKCIGQISKEKLVIHFESSISKMDLDFLAASFRVEALSLLRTVALLDKPRARVLSPCREYMANSLQEAMLYHVMRSGQGSEAYLVQIALKYHSDIDPCHYKRAWEIVQCKYPALRVRFIQNNGLYQRVFDSGTIDFQCFEISEAFPINSVDRFLESCFNSEAQHPFDPFNDFLIRIRQYRFSNGVSIVVVVMHHSIIDGWSGQILLRAVHEAYLAVLNGLSVDSDEDIAYVFSQQYYQQHYSENTSFWKSYLERFSDRSQLVSLEKASDDHSSSPLYQEAEFLIEGIELDRLRAFCRNSGVTLNAACLLAWHKVLGLYANASITSTGIVYSGRDLPVDGIDLSVGLYSNTLPMIIDVEAFDNLSWQSACLEVQRQLMELVSNATMRLAELKYGDQDLFQSLYTFANFPMTSIDSSGALKVSTLKSLERNEYPMSIIVRDNQDSLRFVLSYHANHYRESGIQAVMSAYLKLMRLMIVEPSTVVGDANYLFAQDSILRGQGLSIDAQDFHQVFASVVKQCSHQSALRVGSELFSYDVLYQKAIMRGRELVQNHHLKSGDLVVLLLSRSEDLPITILACLLFEFPFIPVDLSTPDERFSYIVKSSGAKLIISDRSGSMEIRSTQSIPSEDDNFLNRDHIPLVAYVIFTSGTTGTPKGVVIEQKSLLGLLFGFRQKHFSDSVALSTMSVTNYIFDIFYLELLLPWITGGQVEIRDPYADSYDCAALQFLQMTPSVYSVLRERLFNTAGCKLLLGGEPVPSAYIDEALRHFDSVINVYGPTETTIWSLSKSYSRRDFKGEVVIGTPLPNETIYILDSKSRPLPKGVIGELCISGLGVALEYLNDAGTTDHKFVVSPKIANDRLYRTGDLAFINADNEIKYIGRNDYQIKFNGYRIELEEIESHLLSIDGIRQAIVMSSHNQLNAYLVAEREVSETEVTDLLKAKMPAYSIPGAYVFVSEFPLLANGKVDRRALLSLRAKRSMRTRSSLDPTERTLLSLWTKVLGHDDFSIESNFFEAGGNSLLLMRLHSEFPAEFRANVSIIDLFRHPSIASLSRFLNEVSNDAPQEIPRSHLQSPDEVPSDFIAIIGMAARVAKADTVFELWDLLSSGEEGVERYDPSYLKSLGISSELIADPAYVPVQSKINRLRAFDANFFEITPAEARLMDPQHRVFLECVWHALENADLDPQLFEGRIGIFAGCGANEYYANHVIPSFPDADLAQQFKIMISHQSNFLCTRVAYLLNLRGPAVTIQTACSTSLVAVHQACNAIKQGDCEVALAGGVSLRQLKDQGYLYQPNLIFSPDGRCRPFDVEAQGTFEGQGAGVVVLKSYKKAIQDGDYVYAVIKGSAINNDGKHKVGFTAPSIEGQVRVVREALARAQISPDQVSFLEAHGTGTALGDPIELTGLSQIFDTPTRKTPLMIGSVKSNLGHLDVAAGVMGLIKTALCLANQTVLPTLHFKEFSPKLSGKTGYLRVPTAKEPWDSANAPRVAGVSAYGIGGTNAHVILEEPDEKINQGKSSRRALTKFSSEEHWISEVSRKSVEYKSLHEKEPFLQFVRRQFSEILGISPVNEQKDFFDMGGDSLSLIQLSTALEKRLNASVELMGLSVISIKGIVEKYASASSVNSSSSRQALVNIKKATASQSLTLVLVHPVGGDIYFYRDLIQSLSCDCSVVAIRSPILLGHATFSSLQEMAKFYCDSLVDAGHLISDVILAGASFGGVIAYEMKTLLEKAGYNSHTTFMIDAPAATRLPAIMSHGEILDYLVKYGLKNLDIPEAEWRCLTTLESKIATLEARSRGTALDEMLNADFLHRYLDTWTTNIQLLHQYAPGRMTGDVTFFEHSEVMPEFPTGQCSAWRPLVQGKFESFVVGGDHITMLNAPHVRSIADKISAYIAAHASLAVPQ